MSSSEKPALQPATPVKATPQPETKQVKLMWAGGACAFMVGVVMIYVVFSGANKSTAASANASSEKQVVAAVQTKPVAMPAPVATPAISGVSASWIPEYPGTVPEVISSVQTPEGEQNVSRFKSDDGPPKVVSYFQDQLKREGFNIRAASSGQDSGSLQAEDGSRNRSLVLSVNVVPEGKGISARVVTVEKQ